MIIGIIPIIYDKRIAIHESIPKLFLMILRVNPELKVIIIHSNNDDNSIWLIFFIIVLLNIATTYNICFIV